MVLHLMDQVNASLLSISKVTKEVRSKNSLLEKRRAISGSFAWIKFRFERVRMSLTWISLSSLNSSNVSIIFELSTRRKCHVYSIFSKRRFLCMLLKLALKIKPYLFWNDVTYWISSNASMRYFCSNRFNVSLLSDGDVCKDKPRLVLPMRSIGKISNSVVECRIRLTSRFVISDKILLIQVLFNIYLVDWVQLHLPTCIKSYS